MLQDVLQFRWSKRCLLKFLWALHIGGCRKTNRQGVVRGGGSVGTKTKSSMVRFIHAAPQGRNAHLR